MLNQINAQLKATLEDIRLQSRIHRKLEVIDERIKLKKEELTTVETNLQKASLVYQKLSKHSPRSAFFNLIGNRTKKHKDAKKRLESTEKQRNEIASEITEMLQNTHKIRQNIEALEPLEKLKLELIKLKEDYLTESGNAELVNLTEKINNQKLDLQELEEAISISIKYRVSLMHFQKKLTRSMTWTDLEKCAKSARKLSKMSEQLEIELMDVLNRMEIKIPFYPQNLGRLWVKIGQLLEWNYTYEYSQDASLGRCRIHYANMIKTVNILNYHYKKTQRSLARNETKRKQLLEGTQ